MSTKKEKYVFANSLTNRLMSRVLTLLNKADEQKFLFYLISLFYFFLWIFDIGNKGMIMAFDLLLLLIESKIKNFKKSLFITYFVSTIVFVGKTYILELVPPGVYDPAFFPDGLLLFLIISPVHLLATLMLFIIVRDFLKGKIAFSIFNKTNVLLLSFFSLGFISSGFVSIAPEVSLSTSLLGAHVLVCYFYLQVYFKEVDSFYPSFIGIISAFVVFEFVISSQQFILKSPTYSFMETQDNAETWGGGVDELEFFYRPAGTFHHANSLGAASAIWALFLFLSYLRSGDRRKLYLTLMALCILAASLSRSSWLGFLLGLLTILFILEKLKKINLFRKLPFNKTTFLVAIITLTLLFILVLPRIQKSIYIFNGGGGTFRVEQTYATSQIILANPILGVGPKMLVVHGLGTLPESIYGRVPLEAHNWYLLLMAEQGILSLIIFFSLILLSAREAIISILSKKDIKDIYWRTGFLASLVCFLVIILVSPTGGEFYVLFLAGLLNGKK